MLRREHPEVVHMRAIILDNDDLLPLVFADLQSVQAICQFHIFTVAEVEGKNDALPKSSSFFERGRNHCLQIFPVPGSLLQSWGDEFLYFTNWMFVSRFRLRLSCLVDVCGHAVCCSKAMRDSWFCFCKWGSRWNKWNFILTFFLFILLITQCRIRKKKEKRKKRISNPSFLKNFPQDLLSLFARLSQDEHFLQHEHTHVTKSALKLNKNCTEKNQHTGSAACQHDLNQVICIWQYHHWQERGSNNI